MQNPYAKYKRQSVMIMTQDNMINSLFDEMISRLSKGLLGLEVQDYEASDIHPKEAQAIISHLVSALDHQHPVSQGLASLYECFNYQILRASVKKSPEPVSEALPMITELKEVFAQVGEQVHMNRAG